MICPATANKDLRDPEAEDHYIVNVTIVFRTQQFGEWKAHEVERRICANCGLYDTYIQEGY